MPDQSPATSERRSRRGQRKKTAWPLLGVLMGGPFALIGCLIGVAMTIDGHHFASHQLTAEAVVIGMRTAHYNTDKGPTYHQEVVFRFTTQDGRSSEGQQEPDAPMSAGQRIRIYYDPSDPHDARLVDGTELRDSGIILTIASLLLLLFTSGPFTIALLKSRGPGRRRRE